MRSIIDELILAGYSTDFILNGFEHGFASDMVDTHKAFEILEERQYNEYVPSYYNGFGSDVRSKPNDKISFIFITLVSVGIFLTIFIFIYRKKKPMPNAPDKNLSDNEKRLYKSLYPD